MMALLLLIFLRCCFCYHLSIELVNYVDFKLMMGRFYRLRVKVEFTRINMNCVFIFLYVYLGA